MLQMPTNWEGCTRWKRYYSTLITDIYDICLTCCSEADSGVKAEEDFDLPEDTQPSIEEEEQLQKKIGEQEWNMFSSLCFPLSLTFYFPK